MQDLSWGTYDNQELAMAPTPRTMRKEELDASLKSELLSYRALKALRAEDNPFAWWQSRSVNFPILHDLAQRILCVPASSASSERLFSKAGLTLTAKRTRLTPARVAQLVTVRGAISSGLLASYKLKTMS